MDLLKMYFLLLALINGLKMVTCDLYWFVTTFEFYDSHRTILGEYSPDHRVSWCGFLFDLLVLSSDKEPFDKMWEGPLKIVETSSFSYMSSFQKEKKNWKFQTYWAKVLLNKSLNLYFSY